MPLAIWSWFVSTLFRINWWIYSHLPRRARPSAGAPFLVIHQARNIHIRADNPWSTNLMLFNPIPWYFSFPPPLPIFGFDTTPDAFYRRHPNIRMLRNLILFRARDTQMRALYRLYDALCTHDEVELKHEAVYIWSRHKWQLCQWPDPRDPDSDRYTMLAAIMEDLVRAFNWRLERGFSRDRIKDLGLTREAREARIPHQPTESAPSWTSTVPPARQKIVLMSAAARLPFRDAEAAEAIRDPPKTPFDRRNIRTAAGSMWFM
ncbi:hypothetical protein DFH07DRAFT_924571 [Mycena maculata]|uniref:Uncharacterized protein n=1 Tax=Mycena maculata TaxID=230809 RepID=A0AAD7N491_9AGAR|nr:hypothetical protein DFH07DRAFT_924571 [Mycena maculata]